MFAEQANPALEVEIAREKGKSDTVAEGEHEAVFFACCGCAGEERAWVYWEGADEGEPVMWWNGRVSPLFEEHHDDSYEGKTATSDANPCGAAYSG